MLEWSDFVICLGGSETQGLALAQAWSMNRQTLVYESDFIRKNKRNAAPYITEHTGKKWSDISELDECLASLRKLTPRDWIIENQTKQNSPSENFWTLFMACSGRSKMIHTYTRKFRRE